MTIYLVYISPPLKPHSFFFAFLTLNPCKQLFFTSTPFHLWCLFSSECVTVHCCFDLKKKKKVMLTKENEWISSEEKTGPVLSSVSALPLPLVAPTSCPPWRNKSVEWINCRQTGMGRHFIDGTPASGQYFMWEALHCESSLLLVAHSTSLSPLQSRNYCTVNSSPESIISCAVSLLFCCRSPQRSRGPFVDCVLILRISTQATPETELRLCLCHWRAQRPKGAINKDFGAEGEQTLCGILKNWQPPPRALFVRGSEGEAAATD